MDYMLDGLKKISKDYTSIELVSDAFYGNTVCVHSKNGMQAVSNRKIRDAVKYITLDEESRKIWDDKTMTPALKYQNIPQIDISTYRGDYTTPVIQEIENGIKIHVVYSASREEVDIELHDHEPIFQRFMGMSGIDNVTLQLQLFPDAKIINIPYILIVHEDDITDVIVNEVPHYGITIAELAEYFKKEPNKAYVPYRRGWSRLLNIREIEPKDYQYDILDDNNIVIASIHPDGYFTCWDGITYRTESHGVEAEAMNNYTVDDWFNSSGYNDHRVKMRMLDGTHEYMRNVFVGKSQTYDDKFYAIWTIKGINIKQFEFNMP